MTFFLLFGQLLWEVSVQNFPAEWVYWKGNNMLLYSRKEQYKHAITENSQMNFS